MRAVKILEPSTGREYDLTSVQVDQFARELSRTAPWKSLRGLVSFIFGLDRYTMPLVAPDATIIATRDSGATIQFTLYGRTVLRDDRSRRSRQFYMGAVMIEWLR